MTAQVLDLSPIEGTLSWVDAFPIVDRKAKSSTKFVRPVRALTLTPAPPRKVNAGSPSSLSDSAHGRHSRVRFAPWVSDVVGTVPARSEWSEEDRQQRYLCPAEYRTCKLLARFDAGTIVHRAPTSVDAVEIVYESLASLTDILDEGELDAFLKDPADLAQSLESWTRTTGGRGLERWVSELQDAHRFEIAMEARQIVLRANELGGFNDEEVALLYQERSRFSVAYARVVGEADAMAAAAQPSWDVSAVVPSSWGMCEVSSWDVPDAPSPANKVVSPSRIVPAPGAPRRPMRYPSAAAASETPRL
jgi:hypothetical protein